MTQNPKRTPEDQSAEESDQDDYIEEAHPGQDRDDAVVDEQAKNLSPLRIRPATTSRTVQQCAHEVHVDVPSRLRSVGALRPGGSYNASISTGFRHSSTLPGAGLRSGLWSRTIHC